MTENKLNLSKICNKQSVSKKLEAILLSVIREVDAYMRDTAPGGLIGEWEKKEDCWTKLKETKLSVDLTILQSDYYSEAEIEERYLKIQSIYIESKIAMEENIRNTTTENWMRIDQWGKASLRFSLSDSNFIWKIIRKLESNKSFTDKELIHANELLKIAETKYL